MTPEDVKTERIKLSYCDYNIPADCVDRILSWKFNEFHDGANHTVGEYRFWFKIVENGHVKAGYQHNSPVEGTNQSIPWKVSYPDFKGVTSLQQIDQLFQFMHPAYK